MLYFSFHLKEIGWRVIYIGINVIIGFILFSEYFLEILLYVLDTSNIKSLLISSPLDSIISYIQLSFFFSFFCVGLPLISFHIYMYLRPSFIYKVKISNTPYNLDLFIMIVGALAIPLLSLNLVEIIIPGIINLLLLPYKNLDKSQIINWVPSIQGVLSLYYTTLMLTTVGLTSPILLIFLLYNWCKDNLNRQFKFLHFLKGRQLFILGLISIISFFTPPDLVTLLLISLPIILILEISFFIIILLLTYYKNT